MSNPKDDIYRFDSSSIWEAFPDYKTTQYLPATNQTTGDLILVPAEACDESDPQGTAEQIEQVYEQFLFFREIAAPEQVERMKEWLIRESNLLRLTAFQYTFHLMKIYEHLLENHLQQGKFPTEAKLNSFTTIVDTSSETVAVRLHPDESELEEIVQFVEKSMGPLLSACDFWQECAKDLYANLSALALVQILKELGPEAFDALPAETKQKLLKEYSISRNSEPLENRLMVLLRYHSERFIRNFIETVESHSLSLSDLDRIFGLEINEIVPTSPATEPRILEPIVPIPTSAALFSSIQAQIRPDLWFRDSDGLATYQHRAKSNPNNYIQHYISSPGDIDLLPWEQAEQIIDKFGFNTVKLHLIFAAHTMTQATPWQGQFSLKASDIAKYLGWDKRTDLPLHHKLNEIAKAAFILDCLLVRSVWIEGRNKKGGVNASVPTGRMWNIAIKPQGQADLLTGKVERPDEVYITIQPGAIFSSFLNQAGNKMKEALYQFGYLAQEILRIDPYHDEFTLRLAIYLTMNSRTHTTGRYRVSTLLEGTLPQTEIDQARTNSRKSYSLKRRWDNALILLIQLRWQIQFDEESYPEWIRPNSEVEKPKDWRKIKTIDRLLSAKLFIKPPSPIPELIAAKTPTQLKSSTTRRTTRRTTRKPPKAKSSLASTKSAKSVGLTGDRIREGRKNKGWPQRELAGLLDVSQSLVKLWEKGDRTPNPEMNLKLRKLLEIEG